MSQHRKSKSAKAAADAPQPMQSTETEGLRLRVESGLYGICRLGADVRLPRWIHKGGFFNVTRTDDELSILCLQEHVPSDVTCERDWRLIKVLGTLDFSLIGVLASMAQPLAEARIGLLTVSTYDTDYLLVRASKLDDAQAALESAGHRFEEPAAQGKVAQEDAPQETSVQKAAPQEAAVAEAPATEEAADKAPRKTTSKRTRRRKSKAERPEKKSDRRTDSRPAKAASSPSDDSKGGQEKKSRSRRRSSGRRGRRREPMRQGGSLYIGEEWEHIETLPADDEPAEKLDAQVAEVAKPEPERKEETASPRTRKRRRRSRSRRVSEDRHDTSHDAGSPEPTSDDPSTETPAEALIETPSEERRPVPEVSTEPSNDDERRPEEALPADEPEADEPGHGAELVSADQLPADEREPLDEGDNAEGLYTGAIPQHPVETTEDDFGSLGLSERMVQTLDEIGFVHPTPIQASVLPMALEGSDIIGLAETGSGKTGAFGLPLAEQLHHGRGVRGLILCPTREIALQTKAFLDIFGRDHELETAVVIGGVKFGPQITALSRHPDIIVATPGRLADHMRRGNVRLNKIEQLVLDEADHMLDLGFLPQIQEIVSRVPRDRRTMMFSATMPPAIERLAQRFLSDPYIVDLRPVNRVAAGIEHRLYLVESGKERPCLIALLDEVEDTTLVFARRKLDTEFLARQLQKAGLPAERIHSDRSQAQRVAALRGFREGKKRILVATDVAARGIDVPHLGHVINFGLPDTVEDYVHRAGRTARGKAVGIVSSIGTWQAKPMVQEIERTLGRPINRCEVEGVPAYQELKPRRGRRRRRLL